MEIDHKLVRDTLVVRLNGELDLGVADTIRQDIDQIMESKRIKNLIMNMEKVTFIDSSGLGMLIGRYKKVSALKGRMSIVGARSSVEKILNFSGINKLIPLLANEQEAVNI
ncbi:MAG TPA: anti-sigma F factor antagonist [Syntrophomonadaceae bacterium]|nr:anti-sigma F factor antagonist [Syntrophomonadaceae bacterium]